MKYLFFFVHPAKFHVFRHTINTLKSKGHDVDVVITSKDVLEDLVTTEQWEYKNIFPEGRKIGGLPTYLSAGINTFRTLFRLEKYLRRKRYDLFMSDDLLVINGKFRKVPSIVFQDDDVTAVPESALLHRFATYIMSPACSDMGKCQHKKIPFYGYNELGYLHPNKFKADHNVVKKFNPAGSRYFLLRLVSLRATHDVNKNGLTDYDVQKLIDLLEPHGKVFITSEREIPSQFEKYRITTGVDKIAHALYFADMLIADSQTMSAEAGVLGTPYIRYNDFVGRISYLEELENQYGLGVGIPTSQKTKLYSTISDLLNTSELKEKWQKRRAKMLADKIDLTDFMVWFLDGFPQSASIMKNNPDHQLIFQ